MWHGEAIDHVEQTSMEGQDMASMLKSLQQKSCIQFFGTVSVIVRSSSSILPCVWSADSGWTVVRRVSALLESVPLDTQQAANEFYCSHRVTDPGLMGWIADAATKLSSGSIPVQAAVTDVKRQPTALQM